MISKKILFPVAAVAMASFVACGDDSSSGPSSAKDLPSSVPTFMDIDKYECSAAVKCAKIYIEDKKDTMQCDGVNAWRSMFNGPLAGCEAIPGADNPDVRSEPATADSIANNSTTDNSAANNATTDNGTSAPVPVNDSTKTSDVNDNVDPNEGPAKNPVDNGVKPLPTTVESFEVLNEEYPCTTPEYKCKTVNVVGYEELVQCDGTGWFQQVMGPTYGCEDPAPVPDVEEPVQPAGGKVACSKGDSCVEGPAELASECKTEDGKTLLDACPDGGYACEMPESNMTTYLYNMDDETAQGSCEFLKGVNAL